MGMDGRLLPVGYAADITNDGAPINPAPAIYGNFSLAEDLTGPKVEFRRRRTNSEALREGGSLRHSPRRP